MSCEAEDEAHPVRFFFFMQYGKAVTGPSKRETLQRMQWLEKIRELKQHLSMKRRMRRVKRVCRQVLIYSVFGRPVGTTSFSAFLACFSLRRLSADFTTSSRERTWSGSARPKRFL